MTRQISRRYSTYIHVILSILRVAIAILRAVSANTIVFKLPYDVFHVHTKKKSSWVKSGDLGGETISAPPPIQPSGILWLKLFLTSSTRSQSITKDMEFHKQLFYLHSHNNIIPSHTVLLSIQCTFAYKYKQNFHLKWKKLSRYLPSRNGKVKLWRNVRTSQHSMTQSNCHVVVCACFISIAFSGTVYYWMWELSPLMTGK